MADVAGGDALLEGKFNRDAGFAAAVTFAYEVYGQRARDDRPRVEGPHIPVVHLLVVGVSAAVLDYAVDPELRYSRDAVVRTSRRALAGAVVPVCVPGRRDPLIQTLFVCNPFERVFRVRAVSSTGGGEQLRRDTPLGREQRRRRHQHKGDNSKRLLHNSRSLVLLIPNDFSKI